ncbi:hypothetical protein GGR52DRAFT_34164 [Hypoxylon sp. FL1284]|nr:hypothetical protein GGR52DRAFT_34164 [Hypoxylon sp. FL1284]
MALLTGYALSICCCIGSTVGSRISSETVSSVARDSLQISHLACHSGIASAARSSPDYILSADFLEVSRERLPEKRNATISRDVVLIRGRRVKHARQGRGEDGRRERRGRARLLLPYCYYYCCILLLYPSSVRERIFALAQLLGCETSVLK